VQIDAPKPAADVEDCAIGQMAQSVDALRSLLFAARDEEHRPHLWVAVSTQSEHGAARMAAIRAFTRVAMNEMPEMDIRFVEIAG
jgi:outer membrane murein-binding lipoprotein Lpp